MSSIAGAGMLLTAAEAAQRLGISESTLRMLRLQNKIRHYRPSPRKVYYLPEHIEEYITSHVVSGVPVLVDGAMEKIQCTETPRPVCITSLSQARAERELDALLERRTSNSPRK